ncbi:MAG: choice-of-anchor V domain-containing protein [Gemmatimonadales bacterium]
MLGAAAVAAAPRFPERPPPAHTGGFGEPSCAQCHSGAPLNERLGTLSIDGVPESSVAGQRYRLIITLVRPGMRAAGFEASARWAAGDEIGRQAGRFTPGNPRVALTRDSVRAVDYVHHTLAGTDLTAPDTARWTLEWTAPSGAAPVVFHVAANAADDDASPLGDYIYLGTFVTRPRKGGQ